MIRVLNIIETIGSGGVERRRLSLAKLLDKSQFEFKIICTKSHGPFADQIRAFGVEVIEIGTLKSIFDYRQHQKVQKVIADFKPHIIHGAVFEGVSMAAINGFLKNVPAVIIEETSDPQNRSWKGNLLMKIFAKVSDKVVGVSPSAVDYLVQKVNVAHEKVMLITNGVASPITLVEAEKVDLKAKLSIQPDELVIGTVGRMQLEEHKRFSDLIKAFSLVLQTNPKVKLVMVGEGPEQKNYQKLAQELKVANNIIFAGYQNDVNPFYEIFDVFCLTSSYEAFGLVLAEAMLHKLPVVATRVGGMQFVVEDEQTGFLVEKFQLEEIASKLLLLLKDQKLRTTLGQNGYQRAMRLYTEERYVKKVADLYGSLYSQIQYK